MHSSTSNSDTRKPTGEYIRFWMGIISLTTVFLVGSEYFWTGRGFLPSVVDSQVFWSEYRNHIYTTDKKKKLVIVGTSRAQLGIDPEILAREFVNHDVIHLAIDGALPYEVIKNLCEDPHFDGTILADVTVPFLCATDSAETVTERIYLSYYTHNFQSAAAYEKRLNTYLGALLQSQFTIFSPALSFKAILYSRFQPEWLYFHMLFNRFRPAHYLDRLTPQQLAKHRQERIERITQTPSKQISFAKFEDIAKNKLRTFNQEITSRGGQIFFIRMPTTGKHWQVDQELAPKHIFWDRLEELTGIPSIHFQDNPELSKFDCPDTSHLDARDVPEFTRALGKIIQIQHSASQTPLSNL